MRLACSALLAVLAGVAPVAGAAESFSAAAVTPAPQVTSVQAGDRTFESIGQRQGLTSNSIFATLADRHGFVWFAGDSGLHRYDGRNVLSIDREPDRRDTLISRTNTALAETEEALWVLSFSGLLQRLDAGSGSFSHFVLTRASDGARPGRGTNMLADRQGRLWIGTDIGLFRFDSRNNNHTLVRLFGDVDPRVTALALSGDGRRLFVGTVDSRVAVIDVGSNGEANELLSLAAERASPVPLAIAEREGKLWLATTQGLFRFNPATQQLDHDQVPDELRGGRIDALVVAGDGSLWLGGAQHVGLWWFDPADGRSAVYRHHPDDPYSLASDRISTLTIDARQNLWIGMQSGGASRLLVSQLGALRYRADDGQVNSVCAMHEIADNRLLLTFCGGSVAVLDTRSGQIEARGSEVDAALAEPAPTLIGHALVADGSGGYWLPTGNLGLLRWEPEAGRARRYGLRAHDGTALPDPYMNDAAVGHDGRVWVACSLGLASMAAGEDELVLLDRSVPPGNMITGGVLSIDIAIDGTLWLGTTQGLLNYDPASGRVQRHVYSPKDAQSLSDNLVVSTHVDPRGNLWVGTQAGLNRAIPGPGGQMRFRRYGVGDGLPDQTIDAIVSDARGVLWVGTNRGVARLDRDRDRLRAFAPGDGVPDSAINWRAAWAAADGSVYFGGVSGLLRIFPDRLSSAEPQPVMLGSYEIGAHGRMNLHGPGLPLLATTYDKARVRFQVAAFGDNRPLAYRMAGLEREWRDMPASLTVGYDPLPSGNYRFEVRQMGRDGVWSEPVLSVAVSVAPPPWLTRTAYALYALIAITAFALLGGAYWRKRAREKRHVDELHHLANFDALTGLPNRAHFAEELAAAMHSEASPLALLFIDLDRFKNINDSLGHRFGDQVLVASAKRLMEVLPSSARVARLGGDEFTVILADVARDHEAATVAKRLLDAFGSPLRVEGSDVVVSLSVGISLFPAHGTDPALLVQYADSAMYFAKTSGRNAYRLFQPEMVTQVSRRLALESALRSVLENGELFPVFQPQFDLASERICGAEVLLRWNSAEFGPVPPSEFIPILEDTGMIEPVGLWLMEKVCLQMRAWHEGGIALPGIAVNVSVHQLMRGELYDRLAELLSTLNLPRDALELEITESTLMENAQRMVVALGELRALGLGLAIDDFGTGYSSFASLSHLPVNKLKIDKVFIEGIGVEESASTLCAAMIAMAHNLKLTVVAEGVETELQHRRLQAMGCDEAQGFWYCRPLPLAEFEAFVQAQAGKASIA